MDKPTQNYKFFQHKTCEYFPCHKTEHPETFNCIFCYCPLYFLDEKCGGNFKMTDKGIKDCTNCLIPHKNYDHIVETIRKVNKEKTEK